MIMPLFYEVNLLFGLQPFGLWTADACDRNEEKAGWNIKEALKYGIKSM